MNSTDNGGARRIRPVGGMRRVVSGLAFAAALIVVVWAIGGQWQEVVEGVENLSLEIALVSALVSTFMIGASGLVLTALAMPASRGAGEILRIANVYLVSQLLKYLPGRVWSLVYQVDRIREVVGGRMAVAASASQIFLSAFWSIVLFGAATSPGHILWPFAIIVVAAWLWRGGAARYMGVAGKDWASFRQLSRVFGLIFIEWAAFTAVVWLICQAIGSADLFGLTLVAFYSISWIAGSLSIVAPNGLVVREGGFILLCYLYGVPAEFSLTFALVARLVFTIGELMAAVIAGLMPSRKFT